MFYLHFIFHEAYDTCTVLIPISLDYFERVFMLETKLFYRFILKTIWKSTVANNFNSVFKQLIAFGVIH